MSIKYALPIAAAALGFCLQGQTASAAPQTEVLKPASVNSGAMNVAYYYRRYYHPHYRPYAYYRPYYGYYRPWPYGYYGGYPGFYVGTPFFGFSIY